MHWHQAIAHYAESGTPYVIATVLATTGSTPRAQGTKMVITQEAVSDSIGGGKLEYLVIEKARELLDASQSAAAIHHFPLAAAATQCCGGSVTMLLESFLPPGLDVVVFGAGHVGQRVVMLLEDLDARIQWFDQRGSMNAEVSTRCLSFEDPGAVVAALDKHSTVLVMTHDHQLDYALITQLLVQHHPRIGLIGSETKWQRFAARLVAEGFSQAQIDRVRCPIGAKTIPGKQPMAIAIAIVAELLATAETEHNAAETASPLSWRQIRTSLLQSEGE